MLTHAPEVSGRGNQTNFYEHVARPTLRICHVYIVATLNTQLWSNIVHSLPTFTLGVICLIDRIKSLRLLFYGF
jgi:hypothetical protein